MSEDQAALNISAATFNSLSFEEIPQGPVRTARVTAEKLGMLATARHNRLGDAAWATLSGVLASLPATTHDLVEAYWSAHPIGLSETRLIDVGVTGIFLGLFLGAVILERGKTSKDILREIIYPNVPDRVSKWRHFWKG
jgi:hypothetical protein